MATRAELESKEAACKTSVDYCLLAISALDDPKDEDYAKELVSTAEDSASLPADYVAIAEVYAKLGDTDEAIEQYEEAEGACFEALEWANLGHSVAVYLSDKEKAQEYLDNAADSAKKVNEILIVAKYIQDDLGDTERSKELMAGIEKQLKSVKDYYNLALSIKTDGDIATAKEFYKKGQKLADEIEEAVDYAEAIHSLFDDKAWASEVLNAVEDEAQFTKDALALAGAYLKYAGDQQKAEEMLGQAKDLAMSGAEQIDLAIGAWTIFKNKEIASDSFSAGIKDITDKDKLLEYAKMIAIELSNKDLSKKYYAQAESKMNSASDLMKLAKAVIADVNDKDYAREIFNRAESSLEAPQDLIMLAKEMIASVDDQDSAKRIFTKALGNIERFDTYLEIAEEIATALSDKELIRSVLVKAEENAANSPDMLKVGEAIIKLLGDLEFAENMLLAAEENVTSLDEMKSINTAVKHHYPNSSEWIKRVDEKLQKREANQDKYNEYQKREDSIKWVKDLLVVVDDMMDELNDIYYAKKLFTKGLAMLDELQFNADNYGKLAESIKIHLKETKWIETILKNSSTAKVQFAFDFIKLADWTNVLIEDKSVAHSLVKGFMQKAETIAESGSDKVYQLSNLACTVNKYLGDRDYAIKILEKAKDSDPSYLELAKISHSFKEIGETVQSDDTAKNAFGSCSNAIELQELSILMQSLGFDKVLIKNQYNQSGTKINDANQKLLFAEGLIDIFEDRDLAKPIYKQLESQMLDPLAKDSYNYSRRNKLEMAYFD